MARSDESAAVRAAVLEALLAVAPETEVRALQGHVPLREQVDLDSLDWVHLLTGVGRRLGVDIALADAGRLATLDALVAHVQAAREGLAAGSTGVAADAGALPCFELELKGRLVTVRPIRAADAPREVRFVRELSDDARYKRFMVTVDELPAAKLRRLTDVDEKTHVALVATVVEPATSAAGGDAETFVGVARFIIGPDGRRCEFAVTVADAWQGSGLAGVLMTSLIRVARERGLDAMEGFVLARNLRMLKLARQMGCAVEHDAEDPGTLRVVLDLSRH
jgi:acetyltransferase